MCRQLCFLIALTLAAVQARSASIVQAPASQGDKAPKIQIEGVEVDVTGAAPKSKDQWREVQSANFSVSGDADPADLKTALSEIEQFRYAFAALFPHAATSSSVATRIVVFRERSSLRVYRPNEDATSSDAYFHPSPDLNYIVLHAGDKLSSDILREYARFLMRDSLGPVPLWFETGLTEYFSAYKLILLGDDRVVKLGLDEYKGPKDKDLLPLGILLGMGGDSFQQLDKELQKTFTTESCVLFQYLLQTHRLGAALRMTTAMAEGEPLDKALRDVFKLPEATIFANLKNHVKLSKDQGWSVNLTGLTLNPDKIFIRILWGQSGILSVPGNFDTLRSVMEALPVTTLSPAEALAIQGDLQAHNGRLMEAESLLKQALRDNETLVKAHASLGFAETLGKNYPEAHASLHNASVLDPSGNALGYYYEAAAIREQATESGSPLSTEQLDRMEAALQKAIHAAPEFVPAAEMLADTELRNHSDLSGSVRLLVDTMKRSPGRVSLLILLARVSASTGDRTSAGWMLQRVIAGGPSAVQMTEARALLADLKLTASEKTAFANFEINEDSGTGRETAAKLLSKADIRRSSADTKDTQVVRGVLTEVGCSKGFTLYIRIGTPKVDERIENVHSDSKNIDWVNDTGEAAQPLECEKLSPREQLKVAITYRPKRKGLTMGEPIVVEFCRGGSFDCDVKQLR